MSEQEDIKKLELQIVELAQELNRTQAKLDQLYQQVLKFRPLETKSESRGSIFRQKIIMDEPHTLENYIGLRLIHIVGIVVLVIGLSIGVKYAIDRELISEIARIGIAYGAGGTLYFLSWRLKEKYAAFSAILFSGAMASLYFTTYAAFVYYGVFPFAIAFLLMVGLTLFTAYNALRYNRQEIATLGLVGAYAIPFLISANSDRAELLFLYISIINMAVIFLSYRRGWKQVGHVAQIVTWTLFLGWAATRYEPQKLWIGLVFGFFFFGLFLSNALLGRLARKALFSYREVQEIMLNNVALYIAALLLFSPSFSVKEIGAISGVFSLFTLVQTLALYYLFPGEAYIKKVLALFSLSLFLLFVANRWDGLAVTLLWLGTAVVLFAWGVKAKAVWLRLSAIILMGITLLKLATVDSLRFNTVQKIVSYITLGILLLVVSFFYQKFKEKLFADEEMKH